jgi:hypothetical protein
MKRRDLIRHLEAHGCEKAEATPCTSIEQCRRRRLSRDTAGSMISSLARFAVICKCLSLPNQAMEADAKNGRGSSPRRWMPE